MKYVFDTPDALVIYLEYMGFLDNLNSKYKDNKHRDIEFIFMSNCVELAYNLLRNYDGEITAEDVIDIYLDKDSGIRYLDLSTCDEKTLIETSFCIARMVRYLTGIILINRLEFKKIYLKEFNKLYFVLSVDEEVEHGIYVK